MKKHFRASRILNLAIILCFLMPFFYTGCGTGKAELEAQEKAKADSIASVMQIADTLAKNSSDTLVQNSVKEAVIETQKRIEEEPGLLNLNNSENEIVSKKLSLQFPFLKPVLVSDDDTFSGLAMIIDSIPFIGFFGLFTSLLLLMISLLAKLTDKHALRIITLLDLASLIFLSVSAPVSFEFKKLWGFYVVLVLSLILFIYDLYLLKIRHKEIKSNSL